VRRGAGWKGREIRLFRLLCLALMCGLASAQAAFASASIVQVTAEGTSTVRPAWSPDGTRVAFQSTQQGSYRIWTMNADGSDRQRISQGNVDDRHPAWSPDGTQLAVDSGTEIKREIWVLDIKTGDRTKVTALDAFSSFPSWSPDGSRLSFYVYKGGALDLWVVGTDGSNATQLTRALAAETKNQCTFACHVAAWSPDGSRLVFADGDQTNVWTMRSDDGSDRQRVSHEDPSGRSHFPSYLADGRIAYVTEHINPGQSWTDVWTIMPGSSQPPSALLESVQVQGPFVFSPDLQKVLFASPRNGNFDIYMVTLDANGREALKKIGGETVMAPGVDSGHPTQIPIPQAASAPPATVPVATTAPSAALDGVSPFVLALGGLAAAWAIVEGVRLARRRRRGTGGN
jgi:Tol biopolymer transport system component